MRLRSALFRWLLLGSLFAATPVAADVYVIPVSEVLGIYSVVPPSGISRRTAVFQLPGPPTLVRGVSLHVIGTTEVGTLTCDDAWPPLVYPWPTEVDGRMSDPPNDDWFVTSAMPNVPGPFEWTAQFRVLGSPQKPPTWAFLADGVGTLTVDAKPQATILLCQTSWPPPSLTVTGAWLVVDADIPVPAEETSWGRVKAIYR